MGFFKKFFRAVTDPATLITAAVLAYINPIAGGEYLATVAIYATASAALTALSPTPEMPDLSGYGDFVSQAGNRTQIIKQPAQPRRVVYALCGCLVF